MSQRPNREATAENTAKTCSCHKSEYRDPRCEVEFPIICPWWEWQLARHITGKFPPRKERARTDLPAIIDLLETDLPL